MGIVKGIFSTQIKGKVGPVVYRNTVNGQTVSARPSKVTNPRTPAQQQQRARISTVQKAYSGLQGIVNHSFEGVQYGAKSMAKFSKLNLDALKTASTGLSLKNGVGIPFRPLIISEGSLKPSFVKYASYEDGNFDTDFRDTPINYDSWIAGLEVLRSLADITLEEFCASLGVAVGDIITFVQVYKDYNLYAAFDYGGGETEQVGGKMYATRLEFSQSAFNSSDKVFVVREDGRAHFTAEAIKALSLTADSIGDVDNVPLANASCWLFGGDAQSTNFVFPVLSIGRNPFENLYGSAVILSRKGSSAWLRSSASLTLYPALDDEWNMQYILPSYDPQNAKYLNGGV